jgi:hypothetical protein
LLSSGSRPYFFADLCQELDTPSIPGGGVAPSATEQMRSACPAIVSSELVDRSKSSITAPGSLSSRSWARGAVQFVAKRCRGERHRTSLKAARTLQNGIVEAASRYTPPSTRAIAPGEAAAFVRERKRAQIAVSVAGF